MIFDAGVLARGWLSVAAASSTDPDRPQLYRSVHLEQYAHGLRISATDSYMLLTAWIPERDREDDPEPGIDEDPDLTAIARDVHGRAANLLGHLLKLSQVEDTKPIDVAVRLGLSVTGPGSDALTFEGMAPQVVIIDHPDHERVQLDVYDGGYPHLWPLLTKFKSVRTDGIALNPVLVAKLAKAAKLHGAAPLLWRWGGKDKPAGIEMGGEPTVSGLVMPSRWDFDTNSPWGATEADTTAE